MSRVGRGTTTTFEHDDAFAGLREEVRGGETGDPTADDDHIGFGIVGKLGKLRKRGGRRPVRGGVTLCGGHRDPFQRPIPAGGRINESRFLPGTFVRRTRLGHASSTVPSDFRDVTSSISTDPSRT